MNEELIKRLRVELGPYVFGGRYGKHIDNALDIILGIIAEHGECRSCAVKDPLGLAIEEEDDELPARSSTT